VYYGNYAYYFEVGRVEALRALGLRYADLETQGIWMPVMSLECKYVRPAKYDDLLTLETRISSLPDTTIKFRTDIYNEEGKLLNSGTVKLYFLDYKTNSRVEAPLALIDKLKPYFES
jgi:acyl-CoA thioester hydrolase